MIQVSVSVDDAHLADISSVAEQLRSRGLVVEQVHDAIGVISGSVPEDRRNALADVDGVSSVDEERSYRIAPPDSPVQ